MKRCVLNVRGARPIDFINLKIFSTSAAFSDSCGRKNHKNMKKKNIVKASALSLATIALATGFAFSAYAQTSDTATNNQAGTGNKLGHQFRMENNLTDEQKAEMEARRIEMKTKMEANRAAMQTAINSGNYDTWVAVVKAQMGEQASILNQVTADNFPQFVEAHQLMNQAREKLRAIGVDDGMGFNHGPKKGMGRGLGFAQQAEVADAK
jgi:Spy/CpxP family protein refolding chaperone